MAKKEKPPKPIEGAPPWIITFADLSTLMLTFFVLLISFSNQDIAKFREMLGSVKDGFGMTERREGEYKDILTGAAVKVDEKQKKIDEEKKLVKQFTEVSQSVSKAAEASKLTSDVSVSSSKSDVKIRVKGEALFASGSSRIEKGAKPLLEALAKAIIKAGLPVTIEGHTDNIPIKTARFANNWELSGARAAIVARYLISVGVAPNKVKAVGYADIHPIADNDTPTNRAKNRRVEFTVSK